MKKQIIILLSILAGILFSCDDNVEIDYAGVPVAQSNFQVDFDGETWIADAVTTTLLNGEIHMIATRNLGEEIVEIKLLADEVGAYNFTPTTNFGYINFTPNSTDLLFSTTPNELSGRINMDVIDESEQLLTGTFFFIGKRSVQQFNPDGTPILDPVSGDPVYVHEIKDFTNGIFENIVYSTVPLIPIDPIDPIDPDTDTFFVKLNGVEFVETNIEVAKVLQGGIETIEITASRTNGTEFIKIRVPIDLNSGQNHLINSSLDVDYANNASIYYQTSSTLIYEPFGNNFIGLTLNDQVNNKIEGQFAMVVDNSGSQVDFTEGEFSVTYTD